MFFHLKMYRLALDLVSLSLFNLPYYYEYDPLKFSSAPHLPPPLRERKIKSNCRLYGIRKHFVIQIGYLLDEHVFWVA